MPLDSKIDRYQRYLELVTNESVTLDEISQRVADGESLKTLCDKWDVAYSKIASWISQDPKRTEVYDTALKLRADLIAQECIPIADGDREGLDNARDKLRTDVRLRLAAKWHPARYGDAEPAPQRLVVLDPNDLLEAARRVAFAIALGSELEVGKPRESRLIDLQASETSTESLPERPTSPDLDQPDTLP